MKPADLLDLFVRPGRFFAPGRSHGATASLVAALLVYALGMAITRLENLAGVRFVLKVRGIVPRRRMLFLPPIAADWGRFWAHAALTALVAAVLLWTLGAWWLRLRARWSGAPGADMATSREIYVWSGLVLAVPALVLAIAQTALFPSFRMAWFHASLATLVLIVFPFWSVYASYAGVRARFPVRPGRARWWFLILPWLVYAIAFVPLGLSILQMQLTSKPVKIVLPPGKSV